MTRFRILKSNRMDPVKWYNQHQHGFRNLFLMSPQFLQTIQLCKEDSAEDGDGDGDGASGGSSGSDADMSVGNSLSNTATLTTGFHFAFEGLPNNEGGASGSGTTNRRADPANPVEISHCPGPIVYNLNDSTIHYLEEYRTMRRSSSTYSSLCDEDYDDEMENSIPKYLIFSTGSKTYTPHKVGIKRIGHVTFPKKLDPGPSLKERIAARKAAEQQVQTFPTTTSTENPAFLSNCLL